MTEPTSGRDRQRAAVTTHGFAKHPLYKTWGNMLRRCENPRDRYYDCYGGRGIQVCERWHDVRLFVADLERDLGPKPARYSLDRIDNNGNYEPGNVRWAPWKVQAANRRPLGAEQKRLKGQRISERAKVRPWYTEVCYQCGQEFQTRMRSSKYPRRFCSHGCNAAYRKASGVDDIECICHQCNRPFMTNRHDRKRHCSLSCSTSCRNLGGCRLP